MITSTRSSAMAALLSGVTLLSSTTAFALRFTKVAVEHTGGAGWISGNVRPAISPSGKVVFVAALPGEFPDTAPNLFISSGTPSSLVTVNFSHSYALPMSVAMDSAGRIVFDSTRVVGTDSVHGFYWTDPATGTISPIYEAPTTTHFSHRFALSPNGTIAFSTILDGTGSLMRGRLPAAPVSLRAGNGTFYNTSKLDVNDVGQVPILTEYFDPTAGLTRGIPIFVSPGDTLDTIDAVIGRAGIGFGLDTRPGRTTDFAINGHGVVAFTLNEAVTLNFYADPHVFTAVPERVIRLKPGVYTAEPAPFGEPSTFHRLVSAEGPYKSFGRVQINDAGVVVFEAQLDGSSGTGIYRGPDPRTDKLVNQGDVIGDTLFTALKLGDLNDAGQLTFLADNYNTAYFEVWRVAGLNPSPAWR